MALAQGFMSLYRECHQSIGPAFQANPAALGSYWAGKGLGKPTLKPQPPWYMKESGKLRRQPMECTAIGQWLGAGVHSAVLQAVSLHFQQVNANCSFPRQVFMYCSSPRRSPKDIFRKMVRSQAEVVQDFSPSTWKAERQADLCGFKDTLVYRTGKSIQINSVLKKKGEKWRLASHRSF